MRYSSNNLLFNRFSFFGVESRAVSDMQAEVEAMDSNEFLNVSKDDLENYLHAKYKMEETFLDVDNAEAYSKEEMVTVGGVGYRMGRGETMEVKGTNVSLEVPIIGDSNAFNIQPSTYTFNPPSGHLRGGSIILEITGTNLEESTLQKKFDNIISSITRYLNTYNQDVKKFNSSLPSKIKTSIEHREKHLLRNKNLLSGLKFKLKERPDAPLTFQAPLKPKKIIPRKPVGSKDDFKPEPVLPDEDYEDILETLKNMALVIERSPQTFSDMKEEDLRQHYLVQLNGKYEGKATGETFNFEGKTDILIRDEGRNIFIAECKFWKGEKSHSDTIDQLISYLSWRDTKAAIILFNKNANTTEMLNKVRSSTENHELYKLGPKVISETEFMYIFSQKEDFNREIKLTIMVFDVPKGCYKS